MQTSDTNIETADGREPKGNGAVEGGVGLESGAGLLSPVDRFMEANPWHPRVAPFFVYILLLLPLGQIEGTRVEWLWPLMYGVQNVVVVWLLWRYRRLLPEVTLRFHWLAIPTGVLLLGAWVGLGMGMGAMWPGWFGASLNAGGAVTPHFFQTLGARYGPGLMWGCLVLKLVGMSLVVPVFEELFIRSAMVRGLQRWRSTRRGLLQIAVDLPVIGDWLDTTRVGRAASDAPPAFTQALRGTPVGAMTLFAVAASTVVFSASHAVRDWPGCIACGVVWCWLIWITNRRPIGDIDDPKRLGIGPVAWSHGLTNALLWAYTIGLNDWRFL